MSQFSLDILYPGHRNSLYSLEADGFTKLNYIPSVTQNTLLNANTPKGILGGSVAGLAGNLIAGAANVNKRPLGLFINNAAGNPFENSPAVASGISPFVNGMGTYRVFVWETNDTGGAPQTYLAGDQLYASANGLLTKEATGAGAHTDLVAICTKAPTSSDMSMVVELRI
jgi:hypothetical protein